MLACRIGYRKSYRSTWTSTPGETAFQEAGYVLSRNPHTVRQPDVSVLSTDRILATNEDEYFEGGPELAVEVVSTSDSAEQLEIKVEQSLRLGAKQVWVVFPKLATNACARARRPRIVLRESEVLSGCDLLPGFSVKVAELFV